MNLFRRKLNSELSSDLVRISARQDAHSDSSEQAKLKRLSAHHDSAEGAQDSVKRSCASMSSVQDPMYFGVSFTLRPY